MSDQEFDKTEIVKFIANSTLGLSSGGIVLISRFVFSGYINEFLGSSYNRSIVEHGLESLGLTMLLIGLDQLVANIDLQENNVENEKESKQIHLLIKYLYILYLISLFANELLQKIEFTRPLQWEQLVGSFCGLGLGWLIISIVNLIAVTDNNSSEFLED